MTVPDLAPLVESWKRFRQGREQRRCEPRRPTQPVDLALCSKAIVTRFAERFVPLWTSAAGFTVPPAIKLAADLNTTVASLLDAGRALPAVIDDGGSREAMDKAAAAVLAALEACKAELERTGPVDAADVWAPAPAALLVLVGRSMTAALVFIQLCAVADGGVADVTFAAADSDAIGTRLKNVAGFHLESQRFPDWPARASGTCASTIDRARDVVANDLLRLGLGGLLHNNSTSTTTDDNAALSSARVRVSEVVMAALLPCAMHFKLPRAGVGSACHRDGVDNAARTSPSGVSRRGDLVAAWSCLSAYSEPLDRMLADAGHGIAFDVAVSGNRDDVWGALTDEAAKAELSQLSAGVTGDDPGAASVSSVASRALGPRGQPVRDVDAAVRPPALVFRRWAMDEGVDPSLPIAPAAARVASDPAADPIPAAVRALLRDAAGRAFERRPAPSAESLYLSPARQRSGATGGANASSSSVQRSAARQRAAVAAAEAEDGIAWWKFDDDNRRATANGPVVADSFLPGEDTGAPAADANHQLVLCGLHDCAPGVCVVTTGFAETSTAVEGTPHCDDVALTKHLQVAISRRRHETDERSASSAVARLSQLTGGVEIDEHIATDAVVSLFLALCRGGSVDQAHVARIRGDALLDAVEQDDLVSACAWFLGWLAGETEQSLLTDEERDDIDDTEATMQLVWRQLSDDDALESRLKYGEAHRRRMCRRGWADVAYRGHAVHSAFAEAWCRGIRALPALAAVAQAMKSPGLVAAALAAGHCFDPAALAAALDPSDGPVMATVALSRTTVVAARAADAEAANACASCTALLAVLMTAAAAARIQYATALVHPSAGNDAGSAKPVDLTGVALDRLKWQHSLDATSPTAVREFITGFEASRASTSATLGRAATEGDDHAEEALDKARVFAGVVEQVRAVATGIASMLRKPCAKFGDEAACLCWFSETCRYDAEGLLAEMTEAASPPDVGSKLGSWLLQSLPPRDVAILAILPHSRVVSAFSEWVHAAIAVGLSAES